MNAYKCVSGDQNVERAHGRPQHAALLWPTCAKYHVRLDYTIYALEISVF